MMKKYILLFLLIFSVMTKITLAQKISFGIGFEPSIVRLDDSHSHPNEPSFSINANFNFIPVRQLEIEFKSGLATSDKFSGGELSTFIRAFPTRYDLFLIVGHKWHWNTSVDAGNSAGVDGGLFKMPGIGLGYRFDNLYIESLYYNVYPKRLDWGLVNILYGKQYGNIKGAISINLIYYWNII